MSPIQKHPPEILGPRYWQRLTQLGKLFAPQPVWVRAEENWQPDLESPAIAIVGTRRPTSYGLRFVSQFIELLAQHPTQKPIIISGGALGVDAWAHDCAIRAKLKTESWVVGPIRSPNPRNHRALFDAIVKNRGALLCPDSLEPQAGATPFKSDWVFRNAYLVARADVVLVPEANEKSGTWHSVKWANKMGIPVFALPGPVDRDSSAGTNSMITGGYAHPVQSATKLMQDFVVEGVLDPYNRDRDEGLAPDTAAAAEGLGALEQKLCSPEGLQVVDLPGLSEQIGLKLDTLCEYLLNEVRIGKLRRVGNGFERRG